MAVGNVQDTGCTLLNDPGVVWKRVVKRISVRGYQSVDYASIVLLAGHSNSQCQQGCGRYLKRRVRRRRRRWRIGRKDAQQNLKAAPVQVRVTPDGGNIDR